METEMNRMEAASVCAAGWLTAFKAGRVYNDVDAWTHGRMDAWSEQRQVARVTTDSGTGLPLSFGVILCWSCDQRD